MNERESVNKAGAKRQRRRQEAGCGDDNSDEKEILGHASRMDDKESGVQAEVLMADLEFLSGLMCWNHNGLPVELRAPAWAKRNLRNSSAKPCGPRPAAHAIRKSRWMRKPSISTILRLVPV